MAKAAVHFLYRREKSYDNLFHMAQRPFALHGWGKKKETKRSQAKRNTLNIAYIIYNPITSKPLLFFINSRKRS